VRLKVIRLEKAVWTSATSQNLNDGYSQPKLETGGGPFAAATRSATMAMHWAHMLNLPMFWACIILPSDAATERRPGIINSRAIMMTTAHEGARCFSTSTIKAAETRSLSAIGSRNLPSVDT